MPLRQTPIQDLTRGNDCTLVFTINTSVALASAKFTAKRANITPSGLEPVGDEVVQKAVTASLNSDGQITAAGPSVATVKIILLKADTAAFAAANKYIWDLEVFDSGGKATTPVGGPLTVFERARTATG